MNILLVLILIVVIYLCYRLTARRENLSYSSDLCDEIYRTYKDANSIFGTKRQCKSALHNSVQSSVMNQCYNLSSTTQEFKECATFLGNMLTQSGMDNDNFDNVINGCGSQSQTTDEFKHCVRTGLQPDIQRQKDNVHEFCTAACENGIYSGTKECYESMKENPTTITPCMLNCVKSSKDINEYSNCFYGYCLQ